MNPVRLLAHFEKISDAPDAIPRLRRFILDLAVRGKLVPQDLQDEPACELLKRIAKEKTRLMNAGEISRRDLSLAIDPKLPPFKIADGWAAASFEQVLIELQTGPFGSSLHQSDYQKGGVPVVNPASIQNQMIVPIESMAVGQETLQRLSTFCLKAGDIIMGRRGEMGRCAIVTEREAGWLCGTGSLILRLPNILFGRFFVLLIGSPYVRNYLGGSAVGATMQNLNQTILLKLVFGLPPVAEQRRIVNRVDELMELCDRLEAARAERETRRERLAASGLARVRTPNPDTFRDDARFTLDILPALTTRPEQIKQIQQTILNLAVRGKLVPQDLKDEPTSELLKRIEKEKARLIKGGETKREQALPTLSGTDRSFELPPGWAWVRLGVLSQLVTSGSRDWAQHYSNDGAIFVRMGNLSKGHYRLRLDHIQRVNPPNDGEGTRTRLEAGDILISITGDVGMLELIPEGFGEAYINQHTAMVRPVPEMKGRYLAELFRSPFAQEQFNEPQRGIKNSFRLTDVTQFVVPLPPLAEQHRIVNKIDELMSLCDRLETSLQHGEVRRTGLLTAILGEALRPVEERDEAA